MTDVAAAGKGPEAADPLRMMHDTEAGVWFVGRSFYRRVEFLPGVEVT